MENYPGGFEVTMSSVVTELLRKRLAEIDSERAQILTALNALGEDPKLIHASNGSPHTRSLAMPRADYKQYEQTLVAEIAKIVKDKSMTIWDVWVALPHGVTKPYVGRSSQVVLQVVKRAVERYGEPCGLMADFRSVYKVQK